MGSITRTMKFWMDVNNVPAMTPINTRVYSPREPSPSIHRYSAVAPTMRSAEVAENITHGLRVSTVVAPNAKTNVVAKSA